MILNRLENMQIPYYLNIMNFKKTQQKLDHTSATHEIFCTKYVMPMQLFFKGKEHVHAHTSVLGPWRGCVWLLPCEAPGSVSFCITSMSWYVLTTNKLENGESSKAFSKASHLEKDGGGNGGGGWGIKQLNKKEILYIMPNKLTGTTL